MDRWRNKVAVVTGASSGIGAACCKDLVNAGMTVVGLARREDRIVKLRDTLSFDLKYRLFPIKCDVTQDADITKTFAWIEKNLGGVSVLVNNAGIVRFGQHLCDMDTTDLKAVLDTNVTGVVVCTREAFRSMKKHGIDGHVLIINSIAGHRVLNMQNNISINIYPASKYAVTAITEVYRQEFLMNNTKVKITV